VKIDMESFEQNLNGDYSDNNEILPPMQRSMIMPMQRSMRFQKASAI
jgi:hypothetical protein